MKLLTGLKLPVGAQQALAPVMKYVVLIAKHFYFIFVMLLITGLAVGIYAITQAFNMSDEEYRQEKSQEFTRSFRLRQDKETVDRVLQLGTANAGPIKPKYDPSRDNPFIE